MNKKKRKQERVMAEKEGKITSISLIMPKKKLSELGGKGMMLVMMIIIICNNIKNKTLRTRKNQVM